MEFHAMQKYFIRMFASTFRSFTFIPKVYFVYKNTSQGSFKGFLLLNTAKGAENGRTKRNVPMSNG
jgi:hypothetical protein